MRCADGGKIMFLLQVVAPQDLSVGTKIQARDGTVLTVISTDYSDQDVRKHTLLLSDGKTYGKPWLCWAIQYGYYRPISASISGEKRCSTK